MKLQRTTLILLVSALLLGGVVYFYESQGAQKQEAAKTTKEPIFSFESDQIQSVTIDTGEETLEFEQVSKEQPAWRMRKPKDVIASDPSVSFLVNLLVEGKSDRTLTVPSDDLKEYGLDKPSATLRIKLKNDEVHRLILGQPNFNRSFLYAQVDPPSKTPEQSNVLLVPFDFEYAINRPMSEWQQNEESEEADSSESSETEDKSSEAEDKSSENEDESSETEDESSENEDKPSEAEEEE